MSISDFHFEMNTDFLYEAAKSPEVDKHSRDIAEKIVKAAKESFEGQVKHTHPVTDPPYADSFFIEPTDLAGIAGYEVGNDDPQAILVEFGSHPGGGQTETLGYRPLGHGIDSVEGELG